MRGQGMVMVVVVMEVGMVGILKVPVVVVWPSVLQVLAVLVKVLLAGPGPRLAATTAAVACRRRRRRGDNETRFPGLQLVPRMLGMVEVRMLRVLRGRVSPGRHAHLLLKVL